MNCSLNRRLNKHRGMAASACLTLMLAVSACGGGGGGNGPGSVRLDLVIGNDLPLEGPPSELGRSGLKASALALAQIKTAIGETGSDHSVRTVERDQGPDTDSAAVAARRLVDQGASCLTGPWSADAVELTARDVAIPGEVLEITPVPTGESIAELTDHDLLDSTALPQSLEGEALAKAIELDLGGAQGHTVNVAASDDSYGDALMKDFTEAWQDRDGRLGEQVVLPPTQAQQLTRGSPDAILLIDDLGGFSQLAPALHRAGDWRPAIAWGSDQLASPTLPGRVAPGVIDGMRALVPGIPRDAAPSAAFIDGFRSSAPHGVEPAAFAAQEFDATILCYLAAVAAGSTEGQKMADELIDITAPGGEEFTWQQLPGAIRALQDGEPIDYTGASGPIDMDVRGNPTDGVFDVLRYSRGGLEVVGEVSVEKPNPAGP
jgi:ABC-type branched-subunit amino acid transport system substrate-binding protein